MLRSVNSRICHPYLYLASRYSTANPDVTVSKILPTEDKPDKSSTKNPAARKNAKQIRKTIEPVAILNDSHFHLDDIFIKIKHTTNRLGKTNKAKNYDEQISSTYRSRERADQLNIHSDLRNASNKSKTPPRKPWGRKDVPSQNTSANANERANFEFNDEKANVQITNDHSTNKLVRCDHLIHRTVGQNIPIPNVLEAKTQDRFNRRDAIANSPNRKENVFGERLPFDSKDTMTRSKGIDNLKLKDNSSKTRLIDSDAGIINIASESRISQTDSKALPSTKNVDNALPSTENLEIASPSTANIDKASLSTKNVDKALPSTENLDKASPSTEKVDKASLSTEHINNSSPSTDNIVKASPITRNIIKAPPRRADKIPEKKIITVHDSISVKELSKKLGKKTDDVIKAYWLLSDAAESTKLIITSRAKLDSKVACGLVEHFECVPEIEQPESKSPSLENMAPRAPVVTIMGHVDHGKTTLLDSLRESRIVDGEFGGITQHIGAFSVEIDAGRTITFLDTPGHAAFSAMRSRGASCTDIVILVVAADDGVMQQTRESIRFARQANVPIIVAINKIDKDNADVERSKEMLKELGFHRKTTSIVPISALKGLNLDKLKDAVWRKAEELELKGDPIAPVEGVVIESASAAGKGKIATVLVQQGTLSKGAFLVAGNSWAKVRSLRSDQGRTVSKAAPSTAVEVSGWKECPSAGDVVIQVESEKRALEIVRTRELEQMDEKTMVDQMAYDRRQEEHQELYLRLRGEVRLRDLNKKRKPKKKPVFKARTFKQPKGKEYVAIEEAHLNILIKGDVDGSVDALLDVVATYPGTQVKLDVLSSGVGPVSSSDVMLAEEFNGIIYAFNTGVDSNAQLKVSESTSATVKNYNIIYELIDDLKAELTNRIQSYKEEKLIGKALVLDTFNIKMKKVRSTVAGCICDTGVLEKDQFFRVFRDGELVFDGPCLSMRYMKGEVDSVKRDSECGLVLSDEYIPQDGDVIECYSLEDILLPLNWDLQF